MTAQAAQNAVATAQIIGDRENQKDALVDAVDETDGKPAATPE